MKKSTFTCARLSGADLRGARLVYADFIDADLRGADLRGADLSYADLAGARIDRTTRLDGAKFDEARLPNMTLADGNENIAAIEPVTHLLNQRVECEARDRTL